MRKLPFGDFSERLATAMEKKGWRGVDLANAAEVTPTAISRYLRGDRKPGSEELYRIAQSLEVSMEYLLTGEVREMPQADYEAIESELVSVITEPLPLIPDPDALDYAIRTLEANLDVLRHFRDSSNLLPFPTEEPRVELPYYGSVAAGEPSDIDYYAEETVGVPGHYGPRPHYVLRIHGQSMEPDYPDGDYVVVRALEPGEYARKGDIVIASDSCGATMKKLEYRKTGPKTDIPRRPTPHLVSLNPDYGEIIPIADAPIQGVVVASFAPDQVVL